MDVLLLCGNFGNVEHNQANTIIDVVPRFVTPGGFVIWTRAPPIQDRRPELRYWFKQAGEEEIALDGSPKPYGVGLNRSMPEGQPPGTIRSRIFMLE